MFMCSKNDRGSKRTENEMLILLDCWKRTYNKFLTTSFLAFAFSLSIFIMCTNAIIFTQISQFSYSFAYIPYKCSVFNVYSNCISFNILFFCRNVFLKSWEQMHFRSFSSYLHIVLLQWLYNQHQVIRESLVVWTTSWKHMLPKMLTISPIKGKVLTCFQST